MFPAALEYVQNVPKIARFYHQENRASEEFTPDAWPVYAHILVKYEYFLRYLWNVYNSYKIYVF